MITEAYEKPEAILKEHMDRLHELAGVLFEKEKISGEEFADIMIGAYLTDSTEETISLDGPSDVEEQSLDEIFGIENSEEEETKD